MTFVLAIDQGTTSSRAILFDQDMKIRGNSQQEFTQHFPNSGWVEHDAFDLLNTTLETCRNVIADVGINPTDIKAIGITNQRETTIIWDKKSGQPIHNAIVWQDRRTSEMCEKLRISHHEDMVSATTGLLLDPYFSGTKVAWLLENIEGARDRAKAGELLFGTVDSWLVWNLTGGKSHVTDATNAARTLLYDIHSGEWSDQICDLLSIPMNMLPTVLDSSADFGVVAGDVFGAEIPILGIAGDQQAATVGQACFEPGMLKSTYGTGCFALLNTGDTPVQSASKMLTTIAYQLDGKPTYALEGSIFVAGAVVQWLRDGLQIIEHAAETQALAESADPMQNVIIVPAFTGLGAPYWDANCRGATYGLTRNSGPAEYAKAALESVGFQTRDLLDAMKSDWGSSGDQVVRVDGGMSASNWTMQFLADITGAVVDRPTILETTALGAAWLAGYRAGIYPNQAEFAKTWQRDAQFNPDMADDMRSERYGAWKRAVNATLSV